MKKFIRVLTVTIFFIITTNITIHYKITYGSVNEEKPVRISILIRTLEDPYSVLLKQSFEEIQKKNEGKVKMTFYDCKDDQAIQNRNLDLVLKSDSADLILLNLADSRGSQYIIDKAKQSNIPIGLFNIEPPSIEAVRSYNKSYFVGTNPAEAGILQGKILVNEWNKRKKSIDKNGDNILQYVMLTGPRDNLEAIGRTKYSVLTLNDADIKTQEIALRVCDWKEDLARDAMEQVFLQNGDKIEAIIANNDAMAIGAIEVLQKYGYNKGGNSKMIPVVGVDAIPEARDLIKQGAMTGTVLQDANEMAQATYDIGLNLVFGRPPLDGTKYTFDETGVAVRIPYKEYIASS